MKSITDERVTPSGEPVLIPLYEIQPPESPAGRGPWMGATLRHWRQRALGVAANVDF